MKLEKLIAGQAINGLEPSSVATLVSVIAVNELPWVFDGDGDIFKLTVEAKRIELAFLFDPMMAVQVRAKLTQRIENALDPEHIRALLDRNALAKETMTFDQLFKVKEAMEKAEARRLQPYFVRSFFMKAFDTLGGSSNPRETGRLQITHVPASIRERDRGIFGRRRRESAPVVDHYDRICFTRDGIRVQDQPGLPQATLLPSGHPLLMAMSDLLLEKHANLLRQGALMVDPADDGVEPHLLFMLLHEVKAGEGEVISKRLQFIRVTPDGKAYFAGWAPHLDLQSLANEDKEISYWTEKYINLDKRKNNPDAGPEARKRIELLAMQAVQQVEESRGCKGVDVSAQKCGWDITSYPPAVEGRQPEVRLIEVKGRVKGASTITVTRNEILYALNQREKFLLAIVLVDGEICDGPHYLKSPFTQEPDWAVTSLNLDLNELLKNSEVVC